LPERASHTLQPGKAAACVVLARACLQMEDYQKAEYVADLGLKYQSALIDFNELDLSRNYTFDFDYGMSNPEVLYYWHCINMPVIAPERFKADTALLRLYAPDHLRSSAYFRDNDMGGKAFKGSYMGDQLVFTGLTTSELWLTRAECRARNGKVAPAMDDLN